MTKAQKVDAIRKAYMTAMRAIHDGEDPHKATEGLRAVLALIAAEERDEAKSEVAA